MRKTAKELKEKNGGVAAIFDLDGTLVPLPSLEQRFFRALRYRRAIRARNYWLWLKAAAQLMTQGINMILQGNKMYLRGVAANCLEGDRMQTPGFFREAVERVEWHARRGHAIVLMSGTLEPLAERMARALEEVLAAHGEEVRIRVCATRLEEVEGAWTGRVLGEAMFGAAKRRAVERLAEELRLDLERCFAYGDSATDQWLLEAVGQATVVNPSRRLGQMGRARGWPVLQWKKEKELTQGPPTAQRTRRLRTEVDCEMSRPGDLIEGAGSGEDPAECSVVRAVAKKPGSGSLG